MSNFKEKYTKEIIPALMKEFDILQLCKYQNWKKIIVNIGAGEGSKDENL